MPRPGRPPARESKGRPPPKRPAGSPPPLRRNPPRLAAQVRRPPPSKRPAKRPAQAFHPQHFVPQYIEEHQIGPSPGHAPSQPAEPLTWAGVIGAGTAALKSWQDLPFLKARSELQEEEKAAEDWLAKNDAGQAAQKKKEDADTLLSDLKDEADAVELGQHGINEYLGAKKAVEREKERVLERHPGDWPAIVMRRDAEGRPVKVRVSRHGRSSLKMSQDSNRGLGAALLGGAAGAFVGDHAVKSNSVLGSVAGALVGALGGGMLEKQASLR